MMTIIEALGLGIIVFAGCLLYVDLAERIEARRQRKERLWP